MTVKILCDCGTKFAFDIEPVHGQMPAPVFCPACATDRTAQANQVIAEHTATQPAPQPAATVVAAAPSTAVRMPTPSEARAPMRVAGGHAAPTPAPAAAEPAHAEEMPVEMCAKHATYPAAANCVMCNKPICLDCLEQFGYLCSVWCKEQSAKQKVKVPKYSGTKLSRIAEENKKGNKLLLALAACFAAFLSVYIWWNAFAVKPKPAWSIEAAAGSPFLFAQWVGNEKVVMMNKDKLSMHEAASGKILWEAAFSGPQEKAEQKQTQLLQKEDADLFFSSSLDLNAQVVGNDTWVIFPRKVVQFDNATGKRKKEIPLPRAAEESYFSESALLGVTELTPAVTFLSLVDFAGGKITTTTITQAVNQATLPDRNIPSVGGNAFMGGDNSDFGGARYTESRRKYFAHGQSAIHMNVRLVELNIVRAQAMREKTGPGIIDSGNARASQGLAAAEEFFNDSKRERTGGVRLEDQSKYHVTLRRVIGGGATWSGEVVGPPAFFQLKNIDLLVAGKTAIGFSKSGQKLWESKLTYPVAPRYVEGMSDDPPAAEIGARLYLWDQGNLSALDAKNGQVAWRLQSVGITGVVTDSSGKLYVSSTTAGTDQIKYSEDLSLSSKTQPAILKVDANSGAIIWTKVDLGQHAYASGKFVYVARGRVSGIDRFAALSNGDDDDVPIHHRVHRIDPSNGSELWEYYRPEPPRTIEPKQNRILLHFGKEVQMITFKSL